MRNYTATFDGTTKPLKDWGFTGGQMQTVNQSVDTVTLPASISQIELDDIFPLDAVVEIHRGDTRIFVGRCVPETGAALGRRTAAMRLDGAWAELESRQYLQPWRVNLSDISHIFQDFGRVALQSDPAAWNAISQTAWSIKTGDMVRAVMQCAISHGAPLQIGQIDDGPYAPGESAQDIMDADAIVSTLRWTPGAVVSFDYSTNPVTFHCRQPESLGSTSVPYTAFEQLPKVLRSWRQVVKAVYIVVRLVPDSVTGIFTDAFATLQYPAPGDGVPLPGERGAVLFSFDDIDIATAAGAGLAKAIYDAYTAMQWTVEGTLRGDDVPTPVGLSQVLNITGARPAWEKISTVVQRTTDDFKKGTRRLECGVPKTLSGRDLATLLAPNRKRVPISFHRGQMQSTGSGDSPTYGRDGKDDGKTVPGTGLVGASVHTYEVMKIEGGVPVPKFMQVMSTEIG